MPNFLYATIFYGAFILFSGIYRYVIAGSKNALWFAVVMGALALLGSFFYAIKKKKTSICLELLTVFFVGGFFIKKITGDLEGDSFLRVVLLIIFSAVIGLLSIKEIKKGR